jgi:hypothetical protein
MDISIASIIVRFWGNSGHRAKAYSVSRYHPDPLAAPERSTKSAITSGRGADGMTKKAYIAFFSFFVLLAVITWLGPQLHGWEFWLIAFAIVPVSIWAVTTILQYRPDYALDEELGGQISKLTKTLPSPLHPTQFMPLILPSGRSLNLPLCSPVFPEWTQPTDTFLFGGKQLLNYRGAPVFAELYVLRLLEEHGWEGAWISSFGGRKCMRDMPVDANLSNRIELPPDREEILNKIAPKGGGCFDVFAWREDDVLFCECKRSKRDQLQGTQLSWIDAALNSNVNNFLVVEWDTAGHVHGH